MASFSMTEAGLLLLWIPELYGVYIIATGMKFELMWIIILYGKRMDCDLFCNWMDGDCKVIEITGNKFKQVHEWLN